MKIACRRSLVLAYFGLALSGAVFSASAFASGYEFDGIGARDVARGGAVIADVNDWTAIYWNPAGLSAAGEKQAGMELRAGKQYTKDGNSFNVPLNGLPVQHPFDKTRASSGFVIGSLGTVVPLNDKSAIGAGVYTPLLQGADFRDTNPAAPYVTSLDYKGNVILGVANVSYARKLTDKLSAGIGANAIYASLKSDSSTGGPALGGATLKDKSDADGIGLEGEAGLTYKLNDRWQVGAVVRSGANVVLHGEEKVYMNGTFQYKSDYTLPVHQPATSGIGAAWQASKDLKVTCDIAQTWWKVFTNGITYKDSVGILTDKPNTYHWLNSVKFRLGAIKKLGDKYEVMGGYAFDTWAMDRHSVDFSTAIDVPMHRLSAAVTRKWSAVDATLGALAGSGRRTASGVDYSVRGWYVISQVTYRF